MDLEFETWDLLPGSAAVVPLRTVDAAAVVAAAAAAAAESDLSAASVPACPLTPAS